MKFSERVALVTGANRGIGKAVALALAREGADVVITARASKELSSVADDITSLGRKCVPVAVDLAEADAVERVWAEVEKAFGRVDILVNNAGVGSSADPRPVVSFDDAFWERTLRVNLTVPYLLCKRALPGMAQRKRGRIIMTASINSFRPALHGAAYAASKAGLLGLTRTVALEHVKDGVTANAICPGPVATLINDKRIEYDARRTGKSFEEFEKGMTPMGRRIIPDEIAPLAVYLASDEASMVTGQTFVIDGGVMMS